MSKNTDLIIQSLSYIYDDKVDFVFKNLDIFKDVTTISISKDKLYIFKYQNGKIEKEEINHKEKILDDTLKGWGVYLGQKEDLEKYLIGKYTKDKITSGGVFSEFQRIQRLRKHSIYTTESSYICTIVHEFGHIYFNTLCPWYFNDKEYTLSVLNKLSDIYAKDSKASDFDIKMPRDYKGYQTELFAFCTEYSFARKYYKDFAKDIDNEIYRRVKIDLEEEKNKDFSKEDSTFNDVHMFSMYMGKILVERYGDEWSEVLLKKNRL